MNEKNLISIGKAKVKIADGHMWWLTIYEVSLESTKYTIRPDGHVVPLVKHPDIKDAYIESPF